MSTALNRIQTRYTRRYYPRCGNSDLSNVLLTKITDGKLEKSMYNPQNLRANFS